MNLLHCPKCGGDLIVNIKYTMTFTKKVIYTDDGWEELSDRAADECLDEPVQTLGAVYCNSCGKEWRRPFYEISISDKEDSAELIELSREEIKMNCQERRKYFLEKGIKIIT